MNDDINVSRYPDQCMDDGWRRDERMDGGMDA